MLSDTEIESCLAYHVLEDPNGWIGTPSPTFLRSFLDGAFVRRSCVQPNFPRWRIYGVLDDPEFSKPFVAATGHPKLSILWSTALEFTYLSLAEGFTKLRNDALKWHRERGVSHSSDRVPTESPLESPDVFWSYFAKRSAMYMGNVDGWTLYCFLSGMDRGGEWLGLPEMPRLKEVVSLIAARSKKSYGSEFAAYRTYNALDLLEWAGFNTK